MRDLTEALDNIEVLETGEEIYNRGDTLWMVELPVVDAARRYAALTSPETKRKAVVVLQREFGHDLHPHHSQIVEAVLRAVTEDTQ